MDPKGAQTESKNQHIEPQGATKYEKPAKLSSKGGKVEPQVLQWSPRAPQSARKTQKGFPTVLTKHENVPQVPKNTKEHIDHTPKQPTNQGNKERRESANRETNEQTPTHIYTNTFTTRPLESSYKLQTQTQTPAAGCSPKAT